MTREDDRSVPSTSRRAVLKSAAGAFGLAGVGLARGHDGESESGTARGTGACSGTTKAPSMVHYDESGMAACADDHPATRALQADVAAALEDRFPTVGSLMEAGFVPYFDFFTAEGPGAWSHWLSPDFLDDDAVLDPATPESVLVDHRWWRPMGVMFVATRDGGRVDPPPAVYGAEAVDVDEARLADEATDAADAAGNDGAADACLPWHAHVGVPGRYSWWKFRVAYADGLGSAVDGLPCRTPWMMHVWAHPHPESRYAHGAPPPGNRGGPPAEDPGFDTDADPGEDQLGPEVLPDAFRDRIETEFGELRDDYL